MHENVKVYVLTNAMLLGLGSHGNRKICFWCGSCFKVGDTVVSVKLSRSKRYYHAKCWNKINL